MPRKGSFAPTLEDPARGSGARDPRRGAGRTRDPGRGQQRPSRPLPLGPALRARQTCELRQRLLSHLADEQINITITNNKTVMVSVTRDPKRRRYKARIHNIFLSASDEVIRHLAHYIVFNDATASKEIGRYIDDNPGRGGVARRAPASSPSPVRTSGKVYDLRLIFDELNEQYFEGEVSCKITWGRHVRRGKERRSIKLGSYTLEDDIIRIHPGLDQEWVPDYYVRWIVFHEMLHATSPIPVVNGRRRFHTPEFSRGERRFSHFNQAVAWERQNLPALLSI